MPERNLLSRLADAGEEAISKLADSPGSDRILGVAHAMRDRMDEFQKRLGRVEALEKRVEELEQRLDRLAKPKRAPARAAAKTSPARKAASGKKAPATRTARGSTGKTGSGTAG